MSNKNNKLSQIGGEIQLGIDGLPANCVKIKMYQKEDNETYKYALFDGLMYNLNKREKDICVSSLPDVKNGCDLFNLGIKTLCEKLKDKTISNDFFVFLEDVASVIYIKGMDEPYEKKDEIMLVSLSGYLLLKKNITFYEKFGYIYTNYDFRRKDGNIAYYRKVLENMKKHDIINCRDKVKKVNLMPILREIRNIKDAPDFVEDFEYLKNISIYVEKLLELVFPAYGIDARHSKKIWKLLLKICRNTLFLLDSMCEFAKYLKNQDKVTFEDLILIGSIDKTDLIDELINTDDKLNEFLSSRNEGIYYYKFFIYALELIIHTGTKLDDYDDITNIDYSLFFNSSIGILKTNQEMEEFESLRTFFLDKGMILIQEEDKNTLLEGQMLGQEQGQQMMGGKSPSIKKYNVKREREKEILQELEELTATEIFTSLPKREDKKKLPRFKNSLKLNNDAYAKIYDMSEDEKSELQKLKLMKIELTTLNSTKPKSRRSSRRSSRRRNKSGSGSGSKRNLNKSGGFLKLRKKTLRRKNIKRKSLKLANNV